MNTAVLVGANFWIRFLAHLVDFILTNAVELGLEYGVLGIVYLVRHFILGESIHFDQAMNVYVEQGMSLIFSFSLAYLYYVKYQCKKGTTIGKKLFSLAVIDAETGAPMTEKQALIRLFSYIPSYIILGCGFLMAAFHPQKRALHDLIAGTMCIKVIDKKLRSV